MLKCSILAAGCCCALLVTSGVLYGAALSRADREFMDTAARMDMTQAHEGQMAQNQATRNDVKDFGRMVTQDHSDSYTQISQLAAKNGVTIPKGIEVAKVRPIEQLQPLKGPRFERQFANDEIAAERQAITVFRREAERGENADVKAYAAKAIPVLEKDLKQAEAVVRTPAKP
jgi:putative membrane protein